VWVSGVGGHAPAFTSRDVECLRMLIGWVEQGRLDRATTVELVRSLGQTASRLADWQVGTMTRVLSELPGPPGLDDVAAGLAEVMPGLERLLVHAWRRHLSAVIGRGLASVDPAAGRGDGTIATVGFADIAGFTRLARSMRDTDLAGMVQAFETGAADIVAARGGRLVKTLGDEVMFTSGDPAAAVAMASAMHALRSPGPEALTLRIGVATGRLITRMGDVYGQTVILASRLTGIARPGTTLLDQATAEALGPDSGYLVRQLPPRPLRGLGLVRAAAVARRGQRSGAASSGKTQVR
jgi:adenylate cyclase